MKGILGLFKKAAIVLVVLIALGAVFGGGSDDKGSSSSKSDSETTQEQAASEEKDEKSKDKKSDKKEQAKEEKAAEPEPEPVEYQNVDINALFEALSNNPLNAKKTYEGATIRITGVLKNIDASGDYFSLGNGDEWSFDSLMCYIKDDGTLDKIASSSMGDTITVCGTVTSVGEILGYSMDVDYIE